MAKATIQSVRQTETAGLFTISFKGDSFGGEKTTKTYEENPELSGYVINLQKLDDLLKSAEQKGTISIEKTTIEGIDDKTFEI